MRKILLALALIFASVPAYADFTGKDASAATVTFKNPNTCTSVVCTPMTAIFDSSGVNVVAVDTAGADAVSNTKNGLSVYARNLVYNGTTWDRWQGAVTVSGVSTATNQTTINTSIGTTNTNLGPPGATVCATDTGSCSLNALFQRALQTLTTIGTNTGAAVPPGTARIGYTSDDPCTQKAKTNLAISQNGTSSVQLIALSGATVIYVCSLSLIAAGATTVAITTGTGTACVTGNAAVIGSTTANIANSMSLAANGGLTLGSGHGTVAQGAASSELCMILGTNVFVSGNLTYVQQ